MAGLHWGLASWLAGARAMAHDMVVDACVNIAATCRHAAPFKPARLWRTGMATVNVRLTCEYKHVGHCRSNSSHVLTPAPCSSCCCCSRYASIWLSFFWRMYMKHETSKYANSKGVTQYHYAAMLTQAQVGAEQCSVCMCDRWHNMTHPADTLCTWLCSLYLSRSSLLPSFGHHTPHTLAHRSGCGALNWMRS